MVLLVLVSAEGTRGLDSLLLVCLSGGCLLVVIDCCSSVLASGINGEFHELQSTRHDAIRRQSGSEDAAMVDTHILSLKSRPVP